MTQFTNREFADKLANILKDFGLKNITIIDVSERNTLTDYFVLGTARNTSNEKDSAEKLYEEMKKLEIFDDGTDGLSEARWIVIDYFQVMVHIFTPEMREFYNLEKLWADPEDANVTRI